MESGRSAPSQTNELDARTMPRVWPISGGTLFRHQIVVTLAIWLCLVKTSSAAEIVAFPATAGYRRRHAHDHHDSRRHAARDLPQPRVATSGKPRPPPAGGNSEAGKATAVAPDARPLVLGHPFPPLAALARGAGDRKAGNRHRLAPEGISCVLDLEIQARQTRAASGAQRCPRTHPSNVLGEPIVGCSSHPRRTHETGNRGIGGDRIEVHGAASEAAVADVADVPRQPRRLPRLDRFLCGANGHVRRSVRLHRAAPRTAAHRAQHTRPQRGWRSRSARFFRGTRRHGTSFVIGTGRTVGSFAPRIHGELLKLGIEVARRVFSTSRSGMPGWTPRTTRWRGSTRLFRGKTSGRVSRRHGASRPRNGSRRQGVSPGTRW